MNHGEDKIMMLHDDLLLNCLARVSRAYYPTLSLVSKRFNSLVNSTELYKTRTRLCHTETCLYVCLLLRTNSLQVYWFILGERQNSSKKVLVPIPTPNSTSAACMSGIAVVGPNIYAIGSGKYNDKALSSVMVMDSRFHTWREAPSMRVARKFPSVCTLDEKIYVKGSCDNLDSTNWMEIFDAKTQTWELLQIPSKDICGGSEYQSIIYEETVYVRSRSKDVTYKLQEGRWIAADMSINKGWGMSLSYCVIDNVFYSYNINKILWYDPSERAWTILKGLERLSTLPCMGPVKLADHGGKLSIIWEEYDRKDKKQIVWCGEVMLERRQNLEIWGTVEWFDIVYMSDGPMSVDGLVHAVTTTVW